MSGPEYPRYDPEQQPSAGGWGAAGDDVTQYIRPSKNAADSAAPPVEAPAGAPVVGPPNDPTFYGSRPYSPPTGPSAYQEAPPSYGPPEPNGPFSHPMPTVNPSGPVNPDPSSSDSSSGYGAAAPYAAAPAVTSVYPVAAPTYAPPGYPGSYAQPLAVMPPPSTAQAASTGGSRAIAGLLSAVIGLVLTAGGLFLAVKFGFREATLLESGDKINVKDALLTTAGAVLVLIAFLLNGWSPWATLIPGIALAGLGAWAEFTFSGIRNVGKWMDKVSLAEQGEQWLLLGVFMLLGLVMIGASAAAAIARSAGRRSVVAAGREQFISGPPTRLG